MTKFKVLKTIDAYVRYIATVEATTAEQAAKIALEHEEDYIWEHDSISEYDTRDFVTLTDDANEIEETRIGNL
jgi:hypothetical protein